MNCTMRHPQDAEQIAPLAQSESGLLPAAAIKHALFHSPNAAPTFQQGAHLERQRGGNKEDVSLT